MLFKTKRLLAASLAATMLQMSQGGGVVFAEGASGNTNNENAEKK